MVHIGGYCYIAIPTMDTETDAPQSIWLGILVRMRHASLLNQFLGENPIQMYYEGSSIRGGCGEPCVAKARVSTYGKTVYVFGDSQNCQSLGLKSPDRNPD